MIASFFNVAVLAYFCVYIYELLMELMKLVSFYSSLALSLVT